MEVTGASIRAVEFGARWHGYNDEEVDRFLDEVAAGVDELHGKIRDLTERLVRAEARGGSGEADDTVKRTLSLAQRAADLVVNEAKGVAERTVSEAQEKAQRIVDEAHEAGAARLADADADAQSRIAERLRATDEEHRAHAERLADERRTSEEAMAARRTELADLHELTQTSRDRLRAVLTDHLARLERLEVLAEASRAPGGATDATADDALDDEMATIGAADHDDAS